LQKYQLKLLSLVVAFISLAIFLSEFIPERARAEVVFLKTLKMAVSQTDGIQMIGSVQMVLIGRMLSMKGLELPQVWYG